MPDERPGNRRCLTADAEITSTDAAVPDEKAGEPSRSIAGNREAKPLSGQNNSAVDADDVTLRCDQGTARIPGIESRISLDDVVDHASGLRAERSAECTDNA